MNQATLFDKTMSESATEENCIQLIARCKRFGQVLLTSEGQLLPLSPSRMRVAELQPDWVYSVTNVEEAREVIERSQVPSPALEAQNPVQILDGVFFRPSSP
jgi:hypothetical protein